MILSQTYMVKIIWKLILCLASKINIMPISKIITNFMGLFISEKEVVEKYIRINIKLITLPILIIIIIIILI